LPIGGPEREHVQLPKHCPGTIPPGRLGPVPVSPVVSSHPVATRRRAMGLSQGELAVAAGLSRPLVSAVETGRHIPSVSAALALSSVLGATVDDLFNQDRGPESQVPILGRQPSAPGPVMAVRVNEKLVYHPVGRGDATEASWAGGDGWFEDGKVELYAEADVSGMAIAGSDPAMGLAASMLPTHGPQRVVAVPACNRRSLEALDAGRLHVAVVHGPEKAMPQGTQPVARVLLARWRVGLASRNPCPPDLEQLARGKLTLARRGSGADWHPVLERALAPYGGSEGVVGPIASGLVDAVRYVAHGSCDLALTMEAAALAYRLPFFPLEEQCVEMCIASEWETHPGVTSLLELIGSRPFRERLGGVGGYDLSDAGRTR